MSAAIVTKYLGPTNFKGSRISVSIHGGKRMVIPWNSALDVEDNHYQAAYEYATKLGWIANINRPETMGAKLVGGSYAKGYFFVPFYQGNKRKFKK